MHLASATHLPDAHLPRPVRPPTTSWPATTRTPPRGCWPAAAARLDGDLPAAEAAFHRRGPGAPRSHAEPRPGRSSSRRHPAPVPPSSGCRTADARGYGTSGARRACRGHVLHLPPCRYPGLGPTPTPGGRSAAPPGDPRPGPSTDPDRSPDHPDPRRSGTGRPNLVGQLRMARPRCPRRLPRSPSSPTSPSRTHRWRRRGSTTSTWTKRPVIVQALFRGARRRRRGRRRHRRSHDPGVPTLAHRRPVLDRPGGLGLPRRLQLGAVDLPPSPPEPPPHVRPVPPGRRGPRGRPGRPPGGRRPRREAAQRRRVPPSPGLVCGRHGHRPRHQRGHRQEPPPPRHLTTLRTQLRDLNSPEEQS